MEDLRILVFGHFFQAAFQAYAGLGLYGKRLTAKEFFLAGVIMGLVVWVARGVQNLYGIPFGFHIIVIFASYIVVMKYLTGIRWGFSVTGAIMGYILIVFSETFLLVPLLTVFGWNMELIKANPWLYVLVENLSTAPLMLISVFLYFTRFQLIDLTVAQDISRRPGG